MALCTTLLAAGLGLAPVAPQSNDLTIRWDYGLLGWTWQVGLTGTPGEGYVIVPSFESGPTPLALVDPFNTNSLAVGFDLPKAVRFGFLGSDGKAEVLYDLPDSPVLVGFDLRAQALPFPGVGTLFGTPSNVTSTRLTRLGDDVPTQGQPLQPRNRHAQVLLPDGRVLLFGGGAPGGQAALEVELYDPQAQAFVPTGAVLPEGIIRPEAEVLPNGDVLIVGGVGFDGQPRPTSWVFRSASGVLDRVAPLIDGRVMHTLEVLPDGRVIAIGGTKSYTLGHPLGLPGSLEAGPILASTEIFDPQSGSWSPGPSLPAPRAAHASSQTAPGVILVSGGIGPSPLGTVAHNDVWMGGGITGWSVAGDMLQARAFHGQVQTVSGELLVTGGAVVNQGNLSVIGGGEMFDPLVGASTQGPLGLGIVMPDGREVCIPAPKVPPGEGEDPRDIFDTPPLTPPIVYYSGGGFIQTSDKNGQFAPATGAARTLAATTPWQSMTNGVEVGLGHRVTPIDEGLRLLFVGGQGARILTVQ